MESVSFMRMRVFVYIITLIWRSVLPLLYHSPSNTMPLTLYISPFSLISKKPQTDHLTKLRGVPEISAPPLCLKAFREVLRDMRNYKMLRIITKYNGMFYQNLPRRGKTR